MYCSTTTSAVRLRAQKSMLKLFMSVNPRSHTAWATVSLSRKYMAQKVVRKNSCAIYTFTDQSRIGWTTCSASGDERAEFRFKEPAAHRDQQPRHREGSLHESGQPGLVSSGHQQPQRRLVIFQRPPVDELCRPFLPHLPAVKNKSNYECYFNQKRNLLRR